MDANKRGVGEQRWRRRRRSGATLPSTFLRKPTEHNTSVIQVSRLLKKPKASRVLTRQNLNGWWRAGALTPEQRIKLCILRYLTLSLVDCTLPFIQEGDDSSSRSTNIFYCRTKLNWMIPDSSMISASVEPTEALTCSPDGIRQGMWAWYSIALWYLVCIDIKCFALSTSSSNISQGLKCWIWDFNQALSSWSHIGHAPKVNDDSRRASEHHTFFVLSAISYALHIYMVLIKSLERTCKATINM